MQAYRSPLNWPERDEVSDQAGYLRHLIELIDNLAADLLSHHRATVQQKGTLSISTQMQEKKQHRSDCMTMLESIEHVIEHFDDAAVSIPSVDLSGARELIWDIAKRLCEALSEEKEPGYWFLQNRAHDALREAKDASDELLNYDAQFAAEEQYDGSY